MKTILVVFIAFIISTPAFTINSYSKGDSLFVWAEGGLNLRDTNSLSGKKVFTIPYGEKITAQNSKIRRRHSELEIPFIKKEKIFIEISQKYVDCPEYKLSGHWVKIKYKDIEGYVFDGYLSKMPAPKFTKLKDQPPFLELMESYLSRELSKVLVDSFFIEKYDQSYSKHIYGNEVIREVIIGNGGYSKYVFPNLSLEEIMIYMKYGPLRWQDESAYYMYSKKELSSAEGFIRIFKFEDALGMSNITITFISGTIIFESEGSC